MSQMLEWFSNLEPVEKSSAMAIIDDRNFLCFYIDLMRNEHQQQQSSDGSSHALFMKDYLLSLFDKSKSDRKVSRDYSQMLGVQKSFDIDAAEILIPVADTVLLSFLNTSKTIGLDTSDFSDPFLLPSLTSTSGGSSSSKCYNNNLCPKSSSSLSASFVSKSNPTQEFDQTSSASGKISALDMELGYQSAVSGFFKAAVLNVANELNSHNPNHHQDSCRKIPYRATTATDGQENCKRDQLNQEGKNDSGRDHFEIASELNESVAVSFATSGTGTFDCLFLMRPMTEDFKRLSEMFEILSDGLMFSKTPSHVEVKAAISGKSLPLIGWLSNILTVGSEIGVRSVPVPYYMLLLSRIELSMWSAYFACVGRGMTGSELLLGGDDSSDVSQGNYHSILLLPRSNNHFKGKASNPVQTPSRNSLRVLERSPLYSLASTSIMLTLGCIIEEHKLLWRVLPKGENLKVLNLFPGAKTFYSDPLNSRGRPESIVDRLVLCPLTWIVGTEESESDVKRAYEYLEKIAHAATISDLSKVDSTSAGRLLHEASVSEISVSASGSARPGFITFDKNVKRTGAIKSSIVNSVDGRLVDEFAAMKVASIKNIELPSGLTKRKVMHLAKEQVLPEPLSLPSCDELKLTSLKPSVSFEVISEVERNDDVIEQKHRLKKIMANKEVELDKKVKELNVVPSANISLPLPTSATSSVEAMDLYRANDVLSKSKKSKKRNKCPVSKAEKELKSLMTCWTSDRGELDLDSMTSNERTNFEGKNASPRKIIKKICDEQVEDRDIGTLISTDTVPIAAAMGISHCISTASPSPLSPLLSHEDWSNTARMKSELDSHLMREETAVVAGYSNANNSSEIERRKSESDDSFQLVLKKSKKNLSKQLKHFSSLREPSNSDISQPPSRSPAETLRGDKTQLPDPRETIHTNSVVNLPESRAIVPTPAAINDQSLSPAFTSRSLLSESHPITFVMSKVGDDHRVKSESSMESSSEAAIAPVLTPPLIPLSSTPANINVGQSVGDSLQCSQYSSRISHSLDESSLHRTSNTSLTRENTVSTEEIKSICSFEEVNDVSYCPSVDSSQSPLSDQRSSNSRQAVSLRRSAPYREAGSHGSSGRGARESSDWKAKNTSLRIQKTLTKNIRSFNNIMNGRMEVHKLVRIALYLEIRSMVVSLWPSAAVRIFGSCITGLALPSSDIDLVIQLTRQQQPYPQHESRISCQPTSLMHPRYSETRSPSNGPMQDQGQIYGQGQGYYQLEQYSPSRVPQMPWPTYSENVSRIEMEMEMALDDSRGRRRGSSITHSSSPSGEVYPGPSSVFYGESGERRGSREGSRSDSFDSTPPFPNPFPVHFYGPPHLRNQHNVNSSGPHGMSPHQHPDTGMGIPPPSFRSLPPSSEDFNSLFFALTSQLYMQIWASQVNPIPSAAVPVIKLRVAADALLANPAMQQAVCVVHQQQLLSPILEPTTFPIQFLPLLNSPSRNELYPSPINSHFTPSLPSTSSSFNYRQDQTIGVNRDRELMRGEEGLIDRPTRSHQNSLGSDGYNERPAAFLSSTHRFDGTFIENPHQHPQRQQQVGAPMSRLQHQQEQEQQQQQQHHFPYQPPFIGSPGRRVDQLTYNPALIHGQQSAYPPPIPIAFLPFHMAAGVIIAVDITIEAGQHKGLSSCDFVQGCLSSRSAVLPAVVKVVKALLVQSKLNAPFSGGLSSYSAFLLVLAVYDRCQYSEDRQPLFTRRRGTGTGSSTIVPESLSGGYSDIEDSSSNDRIENTAAGAGSVPTLPVTEGEVFLHFLTFYALSSSTFNPLTQGIDVRCGDHSMLSHLSPDQQATVAGGGLWIVDPLDSTKNVARPSFAFRQAQIYFKQCLDKIEGAVQMMAVGTDVTSLDLLKLLMRYS